MLHNKFKCRNVRSKKESAVEMNQREVLRWHKLQVRSNRTISLRRTSPRAVFPFRAKTTASCCWQASRQRKKTQPRRRREAEEKTTARQAKLPREL